MTQSKTSAELLKSFKQYNKVAREKRAKKLGFNTAQEYITFLEKEIGHEKSERVNASKSIPTIHVVDILDASGSMSTGNKFNYALQGINKGVKELVDNKEKVNYTHTMCDFSDEVLFPHVKQELKTIPVITGCTRGSTALYDAIGLTIQKIQDGLSPGDKVLVNIYTDGQENASRMFNSAQVSTKIALLQAQGWTFTFVGTQPDVNYVTRNLRIDKSNSLVYDGTGTGLEKSLNETLSARTAYTSKVVKGQDVSRGFYKNID